MIGSLIAKTLWAVAIVVPLGFAPIQWASGHPVMALADLAIAVASIEIRLHLP